MKILTYFLKSKRFSQILIGGFAILLLLMNTACDKPDISGTERKIDITKVALDSDSIKVPSTYRKAASPYREDINSAPEGQITELYKVTQPEVGGMNTYSDVDPRRNTSETDAKAKALIQRASHPEAEKYGSPIDVAKQELSKEPISERVQKLSEHVGNSIENTADELVKESQKGLNNLSENSKDLRNKA